jgi:uncharacterized membrane protein
VNSFDDAKLEKIVAWLLITGVALSALVVLVGAVGFLSNHGNEPADYHVFCGAPQQDRSVKGVLGAAGPSDWRAVIQLGLVLLILTPIARVAFSLVGFVLERDWTYTALTTLVLAILIYSFIAPH